MGPEWKERLGEEGTGGEKRGNTRHGDNKIRISNDLQSLKKMHPNNSLQATCAAYAVPSQLEG